MDRKAVSAGLEAACSRFSQLEIFAEGSACQVETDGMSQRFLKELVIIGCQVIEDATDMLIRLHHVRLALEDVDEPACHVQCRLPGYQVLE